MGDQLPMRGQRWRCKADGRALTITAVRRNATGFVVDLKWKGVPGDGEEERSVDGDRFLEEWVRA